MGAKSVIEETARCEAEINLPATISNQVLLAGLAGNLAFFNSRRPHSSLDRQRPDMVYFKTQAQVHAV